MTEGPSDSPSALEGRARHETPSVEEQPTTTGTLFIMVLFLMAMAAMWGLMYLTLLGR